MSLAGSASSVGTRRGWPGFAGFTRRGVTMIARSVSFFSKAAERNRAPRIGTSPSQGSCCWVSLVTLWRSPAIAKLWPSRSSITVDARRTVIAGIATTPVRTEFVVSMWLTSGSILRLMTPFARTVGWKVRPTPNFLYSTVICWKLPATGIGNSPPARKLAFSPDIATRFGSARRRTSPFSSRAWIRTSACTPLERTRPRTVPKGVAPEARPFPSERDSARRRDAVVHGAGEDGAAVRRGDAGALAGKALLDVGGEPRRVVADLDLDHADERFRGIVDRDVGGAELLAEDVHGAVGERHHVGEIGRAHDEVDEAERGLQRLGFALRDAHAADLVLADLDHAGLGRGRRERRRDEERRADERRRDRQRERPLMEAPPPRPRPESCRLALSCHGLPRPVFLCRTGNARGVNQR